jgi:hypothetical protein
MRQTWSQAAVAIIILCVFAGSFVQAAEVKLEKTDDAVKVTVDGKPFAEYLTSHAHQPMIWPIHGPSGLEMTDKAPADHPHHDSLWFTHGVVNGLDFWLEPGDRSNKGNTIKHREFVTVESGDVDSGGPGKLVTKNDWMEGTTKIAEDERTIEFGGDKYGWWIDTTIVFTASEGDVAFGDTKEGAFGVRVPATMTVDAKKGGKIRNSRGQKDDVAWGMGAEWVDYCGPVGDSTAGITIFDMPDSYRHPTRWHVRTYGLFAANPFGQRDFPRDPDHPQGETVVKKGETLKLHYRVLFYDGERSASDIAAIAKAYGATD